MCGKGGRVAAMLLPVYVDSKYKLMDCITGELPYLTLSAIHRLLIELLPDEEVDLGGADCGGRLDVEVLVVLLDLHVRLGSSSPCNLPEHGIHT